MRGTGERLPSSHTRWRRTVLGRRRRAFAWPAALLAALLAALTAPIAASLFPTSAAAGQNLTPPPSPGPEPPVASSPAAPPGGVLLDRAVAVVNGSVILESDVEDEMRFAFLQAEPAESAEARRRALNRLIDRDLILQQMKTDQTTSPPSDQQVEREIARIRAQIAECAPHKCDSQAGWEAFLSTQGLTAAEVEDHWRQRIMILSFIQTRFGASVHVAPAEVAQYYKQQLAPYFERRKLNPPPLAGVSDRIREILLQQHINVLLNDWLANLRSEGNERILDPGYAQATAGPGAEAQKP
jgi:hypothetical protein